MKFKPGDKVIFLNEKGGGTVSQIVNEKVVKVSIEDGFEIPYAITELLRAESGAVAAAVAEKEEENTDMVPLFAPTGKTGRLDQGVYLAFVPTQQEKLLEGSLEIHLVNHSNHELLFGLFLNPAGNFHGTDFGFVNAQSALLLQEIERKDIEDWINGLVQMIFFESGRSKPLKPISAAILLKPIKLFKEESFQFEALLRKKALLVSLGKMEELAASNTQIDVMSDNLKLLQEKMHEGSIAPAPIKNASSFLDKHKVDDRIAEIDLHITELVETTTGLSNTDMVKIQTDYFLKCLDQAIVEKLSKMIFIHGVGNGILKNEIHRRLRNLEGIQFHDASYARYGRGATEVVFYRNK
ncbi:MAG TPA: hypothetical protein DCM62_00215 [Bacteroidales bacterium]|nr:hypothetical protein [Bacteroidales bacterium]